MTTTRCSEDQLEGGAGARGRADLSAKRGDGGLSVEVYTNELARLSMTLATEFLMRVLLHTHSSVREELHLWKKMIARLLDGSPTACKCFLETLVERPNWLRQYLLKCHVDDVRQTFVAMLVHALRCCVHFLRGSSCLVDAAGRRQDILRVDAMIDALVSLLPEASGAKTFVSQYFLVFLEYARLGPSQRLHLLQKGLVGQLIAVASHIPLASKVDLTFLHSTISLLVRGCDISRFCEDTSLEGMLCEEDEDQEMEVVNADKGVGSSPGNETASSSVATKHTSKGRRGAAGAGGEAGTSSAIPNPLQLPPPLAVLPDDAAEALFMRRIYVQIIVETCPELDDAVKLLEYCSWQNERFSWVVLSDVMEVLQRAATSEARPLLALLLQLLQLNDSYQMHRQEAVLSGMDGICCGIMDMIVSKNLAQHKRYALLKFVVKLEGTSPSVRQLVIGRKTEWKRAVDWLQNEILTNGAPSPMSTPPLSNEEMTSGYLMRTSTAEWTLDRARNVLSP
ncbi:hypothetical protein CBR_g2831 [Chara braunii]|uniref:DUF3517 domain-containing protein n=1 Tax=Chara braunii TaxID=69332 RepID=A0A388KDZ9_CHABU|nr:hypothetical protein CBR_g2831 [Chara braunii]|eukprot:GBG68284.1 hypothetical protein CBR_g2831 [Chara braunii]